MAIVLAFACALVPAAAVAAPTPTSPSAPPGGELDPTADLGALLETEVVQTASRTSEQASTAPATMTTVTAQDLRTHGLYTLSDVINYFGVGMSYQENGGEDGTVTMTGRGVAVPGDGGNHVLVLVNGHRINDSWGGWVVIDDRFGLPVELIDHIEIINGPGSVMYGTNAMYGVINIVTKSATTHEGMHATIQGGIMPPGDSANRLTRAHGDDRLGWATRTSVGWGRAFRAGRYDGEVVIQAERIDFQGPTHHFGPQTPEWSPGVYRYPDGSWGGVAAPRRSVNGGMIGFAIGRLTIDLKGSFWEKQHVSDYQSDLADPHNREQQGEGHVDVRHRAEPKAGLTLRSRAFGDLVPYRGVWNYTDPSFCPGLAGRCRNSERDLGTIYGAEEVLTVDWFVNQKYVTLIGAEAQGRTVSDHAVVTDRETGMRAPIQLVDYTRTTAAGAVFVEQVIRPIRQVGLNLGARLDVDQLFGAHVSPRAAFAYQPWRSTTFKLLYSEAFRAPATGEVYYKDPTYQVRASGLKAEVVRSLELTAEQVLPGGRGWLRAGGFASAWSGLVGERSLSQAEFDAAVADGRLIPDADPSYAITYDNFGKMRAAGGFLSADLRTSDGTFQFGGNLSGTRSVQIADDVRTGVPRVPDVIANLRTAVSPGGSWPTLGLAVLLNSRRRTPEDIDGAFVIADSAPLHVRGRLAISGPIPRAEGFDYQVGVDYSLGRRGPYLVGQRTYADDASFRGELTPLDRLLVWVALRYNFDPALSSRR
jgi:outer membrane cobalamin receptor